MNIKTISSPNKTHLCDMIDVYFSTEIRYCTFFMDEQKKTFIYDIEYILIPRDLPDIDINKNL